MLLVTPDEIAAELQVAIGADRMPAAELACRRASAMVLGHLGPERAAELETDTSAAGMVRLEAVSVVAARVAIGLFTNPQGRTSYSGPEGLSYAGPSSQGRSLFDNERAELDRLYLGGFA